MKVLVTGSAGHLGEALVRTLKNMPDERHQVIGLDVLESAFTTEVGSIVDRSCVRRCLKDVQVVFHPATLHKPHVATHSRQEFVDVNITGTLNLLEEAVAAGVQAFIFTSTTSVFGDAMVPEAKAPAVWVTEEVRPLPKNIYGVTKTAAEDLCHMFFRKQKLPCIILRTSRFFPEEDDDENVRAVYADDNLKANEYLFRRVDIEDVVSAHLLAAEKAQKLGFGRYIISATTPFQPTDLEALRLDAPAVVQRYAPSFVSEYERRGWKMFPSIGRVYVNELARSELGWQPRHDFVSLVDRLKSGYSVTSSLAKLVGSKGYHEEVFADGPYPVK